LVEEVGKVTEALCAPLLTGNILVPCQAQTWRRPQRGRAFFNPASDCAVGVPFLDARRSSLLTAAFNACHLRSCAPISDVTTKLANCPAKR